MHHLIRKTRAICALAGAAVLVTCAVLSAQYQGDCIQYVNTGK